MSRFRKKPVVIEAVQLHDHQEVCAFLNGAAHGHYDDGGYQFEPGGLAEDGEDPDGFGFVEIETLEGTMKAERGDWIIRGVAGEFYPCKPDIFAATYDPAPPVSEEST